MKEKELEKGQVWQVPDEKWIRVRVITFVGEFCIDYLELGNHKCLEVARGAFLRWIYGKDSGTPAKLVGIKDFKTGKVRVVR